jgi:hypothetical protein
MQGYRRQRVACRWHVQAVKHAGESRKKQTWLIRAQRLMRKFSYYKLTKLICIPSPNSWRLMTDYLRTPVMRSGNLVSLNL